MNTLSGNGALKLQSTGDAFTDQFALISQYRKKRLFSDVAKDMETLWSINPLKAVQLTFYMRAITRNVEYQNTESRIIGQGLKHESLLRMIWISIKDPTIFYENLSLFISIGCWKDIIQMMVYDFQGVTTDYLHNGWGNRVLNWKRLTDFILAGLENPKTSELVKKYLPTIKSRSKIHTPETQADTIIGKYIAYRLSCGYKQYRLLKSSGTAHQWQQQISRSDFNINFSTIHGRALSLLVSGKFLQNHNLESAYEDWILKQPVAKFTGYVYELFKGLTSDSPNYKKLTIDKQFENLIKSSKPKSSFLVVRDTSASMNALANGLSISSNNIAKAMALYFSYFLEGPFSSGYLEFADNVKLNLWEGSTPSEKYLNDKAVAYGSTNFLGVADFFIKMRKTTPLNLFPKGILCLSDGEFDAIEGNNLPNFETFKEKLLKAGFPKDYTDNFKIVLWDIPNNFYGGGIRPKFESIAPNFFYMSGFDPAGVSFLFGTETKIPRTAKELFEAAIDQELLKLITI